MFNQFINRVTIQATLKCVTPIHIGAAGDSFKPTEINGSIVRYNNDDPFIPGSSLKGVLRGFLSNIYDCPLKSDVEAEFKHKKERDNYKENPEALAKKIEEKSTPVERLFGSGVMAGKIKIADATLASDFFKAEIRNGVKINPDTRTVKSSALFDTEVIPAGTEFHFRLSAENLENDEAEILRELLKYFGEGNITVGGRSRAGLGEIRLEDYKIQVYLPVSGQFPKLKEFNLIDDLPKMLRKENTNGQ
jgi:CRISPR-associated RAMP protein (TIGR02581 family)